MTIIEYLENRPVEKDENGEDIFIYDIYPSVVIEIAPNNEEEYWAVTIEELNYIKENFEEEYNNNWFIYRDLRP